MPTFDEQYFALTDDDNNSDGDRNDSSSGGDCVVLRDVADSAAAVAVEGTDDSAEELLIVPDSEDGATTADCSYTIATSASSVESYQSCDEQVTASDATEVQSSGARGCGRGEVATYL